MTFDNSTLVQQTNEDREVRFGATGRLYQLHRDVAGSDVQDQLQARLAQLTSMLKMIQGDGLANFESWSDEIKQNYLWGCSMVAKECEELAYHL